jgi:hypothetical protein
MMAGFIDSIFTIGVMMPDLVGKKLELPVVRPVIKPVLGDSAFTEYLLKENCIGINVT